MSTFSKILEEKLKKEQAIAPDDSNYEAELAKSSGLSDQLLSWLNASPVAQKSYYKTESTTYSIYKKDSKTLEAQRLEREKTEFNAFLTQISSEKGVRAAEFFYAQGARSFMSGSAINLKKDFKRLALKLHPDRHFNEIPSVQKQSQDNFRVLSESYETLKSYFSRAK